MKTLSLPLLLSVLLVPHAARADASGPERSSAGVASRLLAYALGEAEALAAKGAWRGARHMAEGAARRLARLGEPALGALDTVELESALSAEVADDQTRAKDLIAALRDVQRNATFEPLVEAPLPEGFPGPSAVGHVVVKRYPPYRAARTEGARGFWTLFQHISSNDIAMTAPVEMGLGAGVEVRDMAFLYETPCQGRAAVSGSVEVIDLPAVTVLSVGFRGARTDGRIIRAKSVLESRMASEGWKPAGAWRLLGYNSPMVRAERRYWEVQVPVRR